MKIKNRYGDIVEGTMVEFHQEYNYILRHGYLSKPGQAVTHAKAKQDRSLAAAQKKLAATCGQAYVNSNFMPSDKRPVEVRIAEAITAELNAQSKPPVQIRRAQNSSSQGVTSTPNASTRAFSLADAQRKLRASGVVWQGVTDQPGVDNTPQSKPVQQQPQAPAQQVRQSQAHIKPSNEAVQAELKRNPTFAEALRGRPDLFRNDLVLQPYLEAAVTQGSKMQRVIHCAATGEMMIVKP